MDLRNVVLLVVIGVVFLLLFSARPMAAPHERAAAPIHILIVITVALLVLVSIVGGIVAIVHGSTAKTEFSLLGADISTGDVGVALVGIGLLIAYFTSRAVLKGSRGLAALPLDKSRKTGKAKKPAAG